MRLPDGDQAPVPQAVLARLPAEERALALTHRALRQVAFVGGRLAFHGALEGRAATLLSGPRGEPVCSDTSLSVSVSHKAHLAVCLVAPAAKGTVGVDLESGARPRMTIARKVLGPDEAQALAALPEAQRWPRLQRTFALKEATYKAVHPHLQRYVAFDEARVAEDDAVTLTLRLGEPSLSLETAVEALDGDLIALVRVTRAP